MRALLAFDKFKDAISARQACEIAETALRSSRPGIATDICPLTDGGEGFVDVLANAVAGERRFVRVTGPRGDDVEAAIGWVELDRVPPAARALLKLPSEIDGQRGRHLALIEMASASGLALLPPEERDPWHASSIGTGQLLRAAGDMGADVVLLGIGGTATNDAGTGALAALGVRFIDTTGRTVDVPAPATWDHIHRIEGRTRPMPPIRIACDVTNPLLGPNGATAVYGPQKGLRPGDVARMEAGMGRMAALIGEFSRQAGDLAMMPGSGAAGGIALSLAACLGAQLVEGFELTRRWCDLERRLREATVVITGEGRFDDTSLQGKGAGALALAARALGLEVHVFAGQIGGGHCDGISLHAITTPGTPLREALPNTSANLGAAIAETFRPQRP